MSLPTLKFAVYHGTIRLRDGTTHTYSAPQIAALYNVSDQPYLPVDLSEPLPFVSGADEMSYVHLKPLVDPSMYYDAKDRYNFSNAIQYEEDFVVGQGKWTRRPDVEEDQDIW